MQFTHDVVHLLHVDMRHLHCVELSRIPCKLGDTMKVRELVEWLAAFEDQDAIVEVIQVESGTGHYDQGGTSRVVEFNPAQHTDYIDLRGNRFADPLGVTADRRSLLLGSDDS